MVAKHGIPTSEDIHKLREPLSLALTSLSELESHMGNFLLASQVPSTLLPYTTTQADARDVEMAELKRN